MEGNKMKTKTKRVTATATCENYDIVVTTKIVTRNLTAHEAEEVKRKFKHQLAAGISALPFGDTYPHEVSMR
jgi:hypothetical protein